MEALAAELAIGPGDGHCRGVDAQNSGVGSGVQGRLLGTCLVRRARQAPDRPIGRHRWTCRGLSRGGPGSGGKGGGDSHAWSGRQQSESRFLERRDSRQRFGWHRRCG
ncbi:hypothetical protein GCM10010430_48190 [Kitasatospora cystarginea]|uniref:Uncharacterized protein n=1 Tax=Kitasatospora cystarginea TaxID=58350 RepID=A0ABP5RDH6_9ACTN